MADRLVREHAENSDAFISFNYDCVLDDSLKREGRGKWNPHYGYSIKLKAKGKGISGESKWTPTGTTPPNKDDTIKVHKVHGSLHFLEDKNGLSLKPRPYANPRATSGDMRFTIIPPESSKAYSEGKLGEIMQSAYASLRSATRVVIIGYSLPPSDQHAESLLRFGIKLDCLDSLVIVNPDRESRKRLRTALERGIKPSTRVHSFD